MSVINIQPLHYCHILNIDTNITRLEVGPQRYTLTSEEQLVSKSIPFIIVPPKHYVAISDPVIDIYKRPYKYRFGCCEYRYDVDPFPLYPGETCSPLTPLRVVVEGVALKIRAVVDGKDRSQTHRYAGEEWITPGPLIYYPCEEEIVVSEIRSESLLPGQALHLSAIRSFVDSAGTKREAGEVWMYSEPGSFFLDLNEKIVKKVTSVVLAEDDGIYIKALRSHFDVEGERRKVGDIWLITGEKTSSFLPSPNVEVFKKTKAVVLLGRQYCYVRDPVDPSTGKPRAGFQILKEGPDSFFLLPGENLSPIRECYELEQEDALLLYAREAFEDQTTVPPTHRTAGWQWLLLGPRKYCPPIEVEVVDKRRSIPLSDVEGIYVKNVFSGEIRVEMGPQSYLLQPQECLWEKPIDPEVEALIKNGGGIGGAHIRKLQYFTDNALHSDYKFDSTRIVSFKAPGGTAVQVVDMRSRKTRVCFGPELVQLAPFEEFTILRYSAGKPKVKGALVSLCLLLGPDFISDLFEVETLDHARLRIKLASNVRFDFDRDNVEDVNKLFSVKDFIGDCANMVASRVRTLVAHTPFDQFHQHSAQMIEQAIFGESNQPFRFANNLVVSNIDVQNVIVIDDRARNALFKSVQMTMDTTSKKMETDSMHEAAMDEQKAKGEIEREKFENEVKAEKLRQVLIENQIENETNRKVGNACAIASAKAEVTRIEGEILVSRATAREEAMGAINEKENKVLDKQREIMMEFKQKEAMLEMQKEASLASLETARFQSIVESLGADTVQAISTADQTSKIQLLESLGLEGMLVSSGRHPVNLERTANGMLGFL